MHSILSIGNYLAQISLYVDYPKKDSLRIVNYDNFLKEGFAEQDNNEAKKNEE